MRRTLEPFLVYTAVITVRQQCQISDTGFSSVAPDFGAGSWRVPFPDIRAGHHRFSGCHSKEQPKRNRKLTHLGAHFGCSRAVSGPDQPPGKEHKVRASERRGCLYSSKVSSRQDEQFPYFMAWVTQFCQLPPILPAPAKNVPIGVL